MDIIASKKEGIRMEVINYSNYKFNKLPKLELSSSITNTESILYFLPCKDKWNNKVNIFKKFYVNSGDYFGNKLLTINTLIDSKEDLGLDELVFPEKLVAINDVLWGFMMPYIDSINLSEILSDLRVPTSEKIKLLKSVGKIIEKVRITSTYTKKMCLSDIHENNFVVDRITGELRVVDVDSVQIGNNQPFPSKYLHLIGRKISGSNSKYPKNEKEIFIPSYNTDILCYIIMILNCISNSKITSLSIEQFYGYLFYLKNIGFDYDLLECFSTIYLNCDNKSPLDYLDTIPSSIARADLNVFKYTYKLK